MRGKINKSAEA